MAERFLYTNRLIHEKSPYLLQHAHNPVDWYPWGEEAFKVARDHGKPIFLSIGYATCHWCHTMERESFESLEVADLMNETFINIKVDREELPEVDSLYMEFAQSMMAGSAGWPLNVILTPDLEPFFAATYLPPHTSHGLMGLTELIIRIREVWEGEEREKVMEQATKIVEVFAEGIHATGTELPSKEKIRGAAEMLFKLADPIYGGLKGVPKFPVGYQYSFLLSYSTTMKDSRALFLTERTLDMMQRGGIYDHLAGGFSRYSTDEKWLVPHFEKMLYDNALLAQTFLEAWQITKKPLFKAATSEVLGYVLRDMTHPEGGFYSAEDADSEGKEGYFYTWDYNEIMDVLGQEQGNLFAEYYGVTPEGNFEGRNILNVRLRLEEFAQKFKLDPHKLEEQFRENRKALWEVREKRPHPLKDDKVLSSWNGLMIQSLAETGAAFQEGVYINAATRAAQFINKHLWTDGQLLRRWREGEGLYHAGLDEYAFLIRGLLMLFEVGQGSDWLRWAIELTNILSKQFKIKDGAFYQTDGTDPSIILRKCHYSDGAEPSGNAVQTENLLRLYQMTRNEKYLLEAEDVLKAAKKFIDNYPPGYLYHIMNLNRLYDRQAPVLVIALNKEREHFSALQTAIFQHYIPHKAVMWKFADDLFLETVIEDIRLQIPVNDQTTLYICREGRCETPLTHLREMIEAIQRL